MTLEVELVWFGCQTCSDPLLFYHLSGFSISPGSSLFQTLLGCATTNNMHVCTPICVWESLPAVNSKLAQVLRFWLIFRWQAVSGGSSPACQCLTFLPSPLCSLFPSSLSFLSSLLSLLSSCQRSGAAAVPGVQLSPRCFFSYASQTVKELFACVVFMWFAEFWHKKLSCSLTTCNPL